MFRLKTFRHSVTAFSVLAAIVHATPSRAQSYVVTPIAVPNTALPVVVPPGTVLVNRVRGISNTGILVGGVEADGRELGFMLKGPKVQMFDNGFTTRVNAVNRFGAMVGTMQPSDVDNRKGMLWGADGGILAGGVDATTGSNPETVFSGINAAGDVVGNAKGDGDGFGFVWRGGPNSGNDPTPLDGVGGLPAKDNIPSGINDKGDIVGSIQDHGYVLQDGSAKMLDYPGAVATKLVSINNNGDIVGMYDLGDGTGFHSFLYRGGAFIPIRVPTDPTGDLQVGGLNDRAEIVGEYNPKGSTTAQGFLAVGVPFNGTKSAFSGTPKAIPTVVRPLGQGDKSLTWFAKDALQITFGTVGDVPVPGDYFGDRQAEVAVFRPSDGVWYLRRSSDGSMKAILWGAGGFGDVPIPADYDGDGKTDLAVWRPGPQSTFYVRQSTTESMKAVDWGTNGDIPIVADYDGDGKADLAVWRPRDGNFYVIPSGSGVPIAFHWGAPGDQPIVGDFDGDGKADFAVVRRTATSLVWYIRQSSNGAMRTAEWGAPSLADVPSVADYDGDGKTDIAIWRPGTQSRYFVLFADGSQTSIAWGGISDQPVSK